MARRLSSIALTAGPSYASGDGDTGFKDTYVQHLAGPNSMVVGFK